AGPVRALASDEFVLHDHGGQTALHGPVGHVLADRSAAHHDEVVFVAHASRLVGSGALATRLVRGGRVPEPAISIRSPRERWKTSVPGCRNPQFPSAPRARWKTSVRGCRNPRFPSAGVRFGRTAHAAPAGAGCPLSARAGSLSGRAPRWCDA